MAKLVVIVVGAAAFGVTGGWLINSSFGTPVALETSSLTSAQRLSADARTPELVDAIQGLAATMEEQAEQQAQLTEQLNDLKESMEALLNWTWMPATWPT